MSSQTSTISMASSQTLKDCSHCGAIATAELEGAHGQMAPFCATCGAHFLETQAELEDAIQGPCQDCLHEQATRRFLHMTKGEFFLCDICFNFADHAEDYLERCDCAVPEGFTGDSTCFLCRRELPPATVYCTCAAPVTRDLQQINCLSCHGRIRFGAPKPRPLCECRTPCTVDGDLTYCFMCTGRIVYPTEEETNALRRRESS